MVCYYVSNGGSSIGEHAPNRFWEETMKYALYIIAALFAAFVAFAPSGAWAGSQCDPTVQSCTAKVLGTIGAQDQAATGGPQWGPVNRANCAAASREMDQSAAQCASYDARGGKNLSQCAACCRQLREGVNRWQQCAAAGFAPAVQWVAVRVAKTRLQCDW